MTLLQWTIQVHRLNLFAEIGLGIDKSDQSIFDLQNNISTLLNILEDGSCGFDRKVRATAISNISLCDRYLYDEQYE